jgi:hypothetical protein
MAWAQNNEDDNKFIDKVVAKLAEVPGVSGIVLGGSRARERALPDSDWDLGVFVSEEFSVDAIRRVAKGAGWTGHIAELGEWGPVMNGGAWLQVDDQKIDLLWRETTTIERLVLEAQRGDFSVVRIPFFIAGIPTYVPVGDLAFSQQLWGSVPPAIDMPLALSERGARWWTDNARFDLEYTRSMARRGETVVAVGLLSRTLVELAHARMCAAGTWVLNEKGLLQDAGMSAMAARFGPAATNDDRLACVIQDLEAILDEA